jgi:DNA-binding PadR family transcriptional regulator
VLELAILGLLHESPMHGYELRKQLTTKLGAFRVLSKPVEMRDLGPLVQQAYASVPH